MADQIYREEKNMAEKSKLWHCLLYFIFTIPVTHGELKVVNQLLFFFDKIEIDGALDVFIEKGNKRGKLSIYADSDIIDSVLAKVHNKTLFLDANNSFEIGRRIPFIKLNAVRKFPVEVIISVEKISQITLLDQSNLTSKGLSSNNLKIFFASSGNLYLEDLSTPFVQIQHEGTGEIIMKGNNVGEMVLEMQNSGSLEGRDFNVEVANVVHRGTGNVNLRTNNWLDARIQSTGNIILYGKPERMVVDQEGSGTVKLILEEGLSKPSRNP